MHARTTLRSLVVVALALHVVDGCLPATNPWDPDTDPALQVPATIRGSFSYPDRSTFEGIAIEVAPLPELPPVATATTADANQGSYAISVQPGTYWVRASATGYAKLVVGPLTVRAGERLDLGRRTLDFAPANAGIRGNISAGTGLASAGISVSAAPLVGAGVCGASLGSAVTDANGDYFIDGLRPGAYVVVASVEGGTTTLSASVTLFENLIATVDLAVQSADDVIVLLDPITGSDVATREPIVRVVIGDALSWATEMNLSEDPTFATSSGWRTFNSDSVFPAQGELLGLTRTVVYAKFRSPCAESPLYSATITFDDEAPLVFTASLGTVDGLPYATGLVEDAALAPLVVVREADSVLLSVDAVDATGVHTEIFLTNTDGTETSVASFDVPSTEGLALVRHVVLIDPEEGLYRYRVEVSDLVGNVFTSENGLAFRVLRDEKAPTTPLPSVATMTLSGDIAYLWLTERTCGGDGEPTYLALVCEENPKEQNFFEVRGGPVFVDFTGFDNPPFAVPVHKDGVTNIEIRAVDEAGNASESLGQVAVLHTSTRTVQTLPATKSFESDGRTNLVSVGSTAFYAVEPRPGTQNGTRYGVLVAQSASSPGINIDPTNGDIPFGVRHLSWGCNTSAPATDAMCGEPLRRAGPLAAHGGALHWLEYSGMYTFATPLEVRARLFRSRPQANGNYAIRSIPSAPSGVGAVLDEHGLLAQSVEVCETAGATECGQIEAWSGLTQVPPRHLSVSDDAVVASGVATAAMPLGDVDGPITTEVVTGPAIVAMQVTRREGSRLLGIQMGIDASEGQLLRTAGFRRFTSGTTWNAAPTTPSVDAARLGILATGLGHETFIVSEGLHDSGSNTFTMLVGALIPSGVTVTIAKRPAAPDDGVYSLEEPFLVNGLVVQTLADDQPDNLAVASLTVRTNESIVGALLLQDPDLSTYEGTVSGVTRLDFGATSAITSLTARASTLDAATASRHSTLARAPRAVDEVHLADESATALEVPTMCAIALEVTDETTLLDIAVPGRGMVEDFTAHLFKSANGTPEGTYNGAPLFHGTTANFSGWTYVNLDGKETVDCASNLLGDVETLTFSGVIEREILVDTTFVASGDATEWTGIGPEGAMSAATILPMPATTTAWEIYLAANPVNDPFDADLYASYGVDPTLADADLASFNNGSSEYIEATNTGLGDLHVAVSGWDGPAGFGAYAARMDLVSVLDLPAGASIEVDMTGTGDGDLYVRLGGDPSFYDWDCSPYIPNNSSESCTVTATVDTTAHIGVAFYGPTDVSLDVRVVTDTAPTVIATVPMPNPANGYRVSFTSPSPATLRVGHGFVPSSGSHDCQVNAGAPACTPSTNKLPVTGDIVLTIQSTAETTPYDVTLVLEERGCTGAVAANGGIGSSASAQLTPGIYLLTLGSATASSFALTMPSSAPQVMRGPRVVGDGSVRVLGAPVSAFASAGTAVVSSVSPTLPICDFEMTFTAREIFTRAIPLGDHTLAAGLTTSAVGGERSRIARVGVDPTAVEPSDETIVELDDGRRALEIAVEDGVLSWLETDAAGGEASLQSLPLTDGVPTGALCPPIPLSSIVAPLDVTASAISGRALTVGGDTGVGGAVHLFTISSLDDEGCPGLTLVRSRSVSGSVRAVHGDVDDLFAIARDTSGIERLMHFDGRDVVPVYSGTAQQPVGFDVDTTTIAVAVGPSSSGDGYLMLLDSKTNVLIEATQVARRRLVVHPRFVTNGVVALERTDEGALAARAYPRRTHEGVPLDDVSALFAGAPAFVPTDPFADARTPMLESHGTTVAVLGYSGGGRALSVYELAVVDDGEDVTAVAVPVFGPHAVASQPSALQVGAGLVVITWPDTSSVVVRQGDDGTYALDAAQPAGRRVVGLVDDALLTFDDPGPVFVAKPPVTLAAALRTPDATTPLTFAGDGYFHDFTSVDSNGQGDVFLMDASVSPNVVWRLRAGSSSYMPVDGPHRPLLVGTEGLGTSAMPRASSSGIYYIRRTTTGNALYRMRL